LLYLVPGTDGGYAVLLVPGEPDGDGLAGLRVSTLLLNRLIEKELGQQARDLRNGIMIAGSNVRAAAYSAPGLNLAWRCSRPGP